MRHFQIVIQHRIHFIHTKQALKVLFMLGKLSYKKQVLLTLSQMDPRWPQETDPFANAHIAITQ